MVGALTAIGPALVGVFALAATLLVGQATLGASEELQASSHVPLLLVAGLGSAILLAMLEEIGWRGYLVPRLLSLGQTRALVISGLVRATWHMPFGSRALRQRRRQRAAGLESTRRRFRPARQCRPMREIRPVGKRCRCRDA
jgi:membrane protease YdiL (CAAX protease family)